MSITERREFQDGALDTPAFRDTALKVIRMEPGKHGGLHSIIYIVFGV